MSDEKKAEAEVRAAEAAEELDRIADGIDGTETEERLRAVARRLRGL